MIKGPPQIQSFIQYSREDRLMLPLLVVTVERVQSDRPMPIDAGKNALSPPIGALPVKRKAGLFLLAVILAVTLGTALVVSWRMYSLVSKKQAKRSITSRPASPNASTSSR